MNNLNILISQRGKKTTSIVIYGNYKATASNTWDNRPFEGWTGQNATLTAIKEIQKQIEEETKQTILYWSKRKRWTKSLDCYLLNELNYNSIYKELEQTFKDLKNKNKQEEYIKNNIINYINIY